MKENGRKEKEREGKERKGKERKGKQRKGKERKEKERKGKKKERKEKERKEKERKEKKSPPCTQDLPRRDGSVHREGAVVPIGGWLVYPRGQATPGTIIYFLITVSLKKI